MRAVAHRGRATPADECLLWGEERTWRGLVSMSANDPKRTLANLRFHAVIRGRFGLEFLRPNFTAATAEGDENGLVTPDRS
jgi:hypothetical protein